MFCCYDMMSSFASFAACYYGAAWVILSFHVSVVSQPLCICKPPWRIHRSGRCFQFVIHPSKAQCPVTKRLRDTSEFLFLSCLIVVPFFQFFCHLTSFPIYYLLSWFIASRVKIRELFEDRPCDSMKFNQCQSSLPRILIFFFMTYARCLFIYLQCQLKYG